MRYATGMLSSGARAVDIDIDEGSLRAVMPGASSVVAQADGSAVTVQLKGVEPALKAFKACEDGLLRSWGADPSAMTAFIDTRLVSTWFGRDSYPPAALRVRASAQVIAMVTVDPQGKPVACRAVAGSGNADLDEGTCLILQRRARYLPAEAGMTANRFSVTSVRWVMS